MTRLLAIALEAVGICAIISGLVTEFMTQADVGFALITSGSAIVALGSLVWAKLLRR